MPSNGGVLHRLVIANLRQKNPAIETTGFVQALRRLIWECGAGDDIQRFTKEGHEIPMQMPGDCRT
jgi:hypothetical protein